MLFACASLLFYSCNDWLDVNPRSQIKEKVLYETEDGYKKALNGVYIKMANGNLYGKDVNMYFADALVRSWTIPTFANNELLNSLSNLDYKNSKVETLIYSIWLNHYLAIAQINDLLANLELEDESKFTSNNDKLIKGEALGLRAFLHLEMLRFFGPIPNDAVDAENAIPYVKEMTNNPTKLVSKSWGEVITSLEDDLSNAEELLKIYDPIVHNSIDSLNSTRFLGVGSMPNDEWQLYRQGRFNYYAVLGTKARLYHWIGDKEMAVMYAKSVIDSQKIPLMSENLFSSSVTASLEMKPEHLFGVENPELQTVVSGLFSVSTPELTQTVANINSAYESTVHVNDIRNVSKRYWDQKTYLSGAPVNHFYKYTGNDRIPHKNVIPLLRLSEMYFIAIENSTLAEAKVYFSKFRISRAMNASIDDSSTANEEALLNRLEKEYRKEFLGEGQMFFFYKKHKYERYTWPRNFTLPGDAYVIPMPKEQSNFE